MCSSTVAHRGPTDLNYAPLTIEVCVVPITLCFNVIRDSVTRQQTVPVPNSNAREGLTT